MVDKVYQTSKYLPVINVKTENRALNHVFREIVFDGEVFYHDIYLDKNKDTNEIEY